MCLLDMFVGRKYELNLLTKLHSSKKSSIVVIKGRRRIGKSSLAKEFARDKRFISFTGVAPVKGVSSQDQLDEFARQFYSFFKLPPITFKDWSDAFLNLTAQLDDKPTVILLDEISWMGSLDPLFVPKIKIWWDNHISELSNITLILCGSVSTWIEKNIINSTSLFGRIALQITLDDLSIKESIELLRKRGAKYSIFEIINILSITGGVPWYLERIDVRESVEYNIKNLCFSKNGLLVSEFDRIFNDLFDAKSNIYLKIVELLSEGMRTLTELRNALNYSDSGSFSDYLKALVISGFVSFNYQWNLSNGKATRSGLYRLSDNYLRFYLKHIKKNINKILQGNFANISIYSLPGWDTISGLQFENLLLKNNSMLLDKIGINTNDIIAENPYIQQKTSKKQKCQIDYMIQTKTKNLYICEFKFRKSRISTDVIEDVKEKISKLQIPIGFGIVPILFYVGDLSEKVIDSEFFYKIINLEDELSITNY